MTDLKVKCEHCGGKYEYIIGESIFINRGAGVSLKEKKKNYLHCMECHAVDFDTYTWKMALQKQRLNELKKIAVKKEK